MPAHVAALLCVAPAPLTFALHSAGCRAACSEWLVNQHRDSYASYLGHYNILMHIAVAENESIGRVKFNMLEVRLASPPCVPRGRRP